MCVEMAVCASDTYVSADRPSRVLRFENVVLWTARGFMFYLVPSPLRWRFAGGLPCCFARSDSLASLARTLCTFSLPKDTSSIQVGCNDSV